MSEGLSGPANTDVVPLDNKWIVSLICCCNLQLTDPEHLNHKDRDSVGYNPHHWCQFLMTTVVSFCHFFLLFL